MLSYIYNLATDKHNGLSAVIVKFFLYLLSLIYGVAVRLLIFIHRLRPHRLSCKVISVGNITLGGTGKTSLVLLIARYLKEKGHKVAVLTRGYKRKVASRRSQVARQETMGDEPYMLKMSLKDVPVLVDADRNRSANLAIRQYGADAVILDDGLQQWRIKKDLEIVTIDSTDPFGNGSLIPRGILRQPLSYLKYADIFVLTKTNFSRDIQDLKDFLNQLSPSALIVESIHLPLGFFGLDRPEEMLDINTLQAKSVTLFCAIGDPDSFESLIISSGINIGLAFRFPDHHNYTKEELDKIIKDSHDKNIDTIITTEKDAARLNSQRSTVNGQRSTVHGPQLFYLRIELKITKNEQEFYNRLLRVYSY